jgi:hypothetical protein
VQSYFKEIIQKEDTRGKQRIKKKQRKLNEYNMYNGAWRNFI